MKTLFVHDHIFPKKEGNYYESYGFDEEFIDRYTSFTDTLEIIGRERELYGEVNELKRIDQHATFYTIPNFKVLNNTKIKNTVNNKIKECDNLIIRLPSIIGLYALSKAKKYKKPFFIEVVGNAWDSLWNQSLSKKFMAPLVDVMCKRAILDATHVVYVTKEYLQQKYPTNGKSIACSNVTINSIDKNLLKQRTEKIKKLSSHNFVLGTCATLNVYKGQQDVIKVVSKLKSLGYEIRYELVGGGDPNYLKKLAKEYGVEENIIFIGRLNHKEVFKWLDQIDLYLQPSLTEGLPRALIEAMSRGCPAIGSNAGGIPELIDKDYIYPKGKSELAFNIFRKMHIEDLKQQSIINQATSQQYIKSILTEKREKFFHEFIKDIKERGDKN
ncbi:glycosyltransferase family 4 protein [Alkalicoccus luteus]|uniref:Glycosyltransferase family 4 protein n=1 Tax=Alkalicoccus luteus TaxID=1237094 RepID=A0A969PNH1_9BACI|nr:glycosyltransferase [Alkalicoccus luteus]NJP37452.1 glycosyltransferase family 4 protein [Alkalicoccus luteus]